MELRWRNRSFQGPKCIRLNKICKEARNVPEWVAREALGKKSFPDKEMPCWIWISGIAATVTIGAMAAVAMRGRKRERDVEADADGEASPRKALRGSISHDMHYEEKARLKQRISSRGGQKRYRPHCQFVIYNLALQIFGPKGSKLVTALESELHRRFAMTDLGPSVAYLGMEIQKNRRKRTVHENISQW